MRKDLIVGNWKMNATHLEAIQMVQKLSYRLDGLEMGGVHLPVTDDQVLAHVSSISPTR